MPADTADERTDCGDRTWPHLWSAGPTCTGPHRHRQLLPLKHFRNLLPSLYLWSGGHLCPGGGTGGSRPVERRIPTGDWETTVVDFWAHHRNGAVLCKSVFSIPLHLRSKERKPAYGVDWAPFALAFITCIKLHSVFPLLGVRSTQPNILILSL